MTALKRIVDPAVLPISLDQAKAQLRVTTSDQDDKITGYIQAATDYIEGEWGFLGRALVTQTWRLTLDSFPSTGTTYLTYMGYYWGDLATGYSGGTLGQIKIPLPPLQSVAQIAYDDGNGDEQIVDPAAYFVDNASEPGWITPVANKPWPATLSAINTVRIDFVAGYDPDSSSPPDLTRKIPSNIKQAILLMVSNWMENAEGVTDTRMNILPHGADILLRRHKIQKSLA
jgi:uncharacterized phiE125 gp8 family phage protein